ncbi:hypothetical protein [Sphingopyxis panaciterrae]
MATPSLASFIATKYRSGTSTRLPTPPQIPDRNPLLARLVGEIVMNARSQKDDDTGGHRLEQPVVVHERRRLAMLVPGWLSSGSPARDIAAMPFRAMTLEDVSETRAKTYYLPALKGCKTLSKSI